MRRLERIVEEIIAVKFNPGCFVRPVAYRPDFGSTGGKRVAFFEDNHLEPVLSR